MLCHENSFKRFITFLIKNRCNQTVKKEKLWTNKIPLIGSILLPTNNLFENLNTWYADLKLFVQYLCLEIPVSVINNILCNGKCLFEFIRKKLLECTSSNYRTKSLNLGSVAHGSIFENWQKNTWIMFKILLIKEKKFEVSLRKLKNHQKKWP